MNFSLFIKKYLIWVIAGPLIVALGLFSWNYMHKKALKDKQDDTEITGPQPFLPPEDNGPLDPEIIKRNTLSEAIKKFRTAKSFKVDIEQDMQDGKIISNLEYVKPLRLHAIMTMPDKTIFDTIIIGETVYIRKGLDEWEISNDAFAKDFGKKFFTSMITSDDTPASFGIADNAPIETQDNPGKKCLLYKTQYNINNEINDIHFCIDSNNEIASIKTITKDGEVFAQYKDYNSLFLIERPRMPLLELRSPIAE